MNLFFRIPFAAALIGVSALASAHDPAEHAKEAAQARQGADCSALDHQAMDAKDPVAQALMAKCGLQGHDHRDHEDPAPAATPPPAPAQHGDHG